MPSAQVSGRSDRAWVSPHSTQTNVVSELYGSALPLLFDLVLLGLTFNKAARVWRAGGRVPLLSLLVRDGVWAFLAVLGMLSSNPLVHRVAHAPRKRSST
jgi:hypothetical protein